MKNFENDIIGGALHQGVRNSEKSCTRFQIFAIFQDFKQLWQDFRTFEILHIRNNSIT